MLVLSRKPGEKIVIGDGIELMVVAVNGNRVRLGFVAPEKFRIVRAECRTGEHRAGENRAGENRTKEPQPAEPPCERTFMAGCGV